MTTTLRHRRSKRARNCVWRIPCRLLYAVRPSTSVKCAEWLRNLVLLLSGALFFGALSRPPVHLPLRYVKPRRCPYPETSSLRYGPKISSSVSAQLTRAPPVEHCGKTQCTALRSGTGKQTNHHQALGLRAYREQTKQMQKKNARLRNGVATVGSAHCRLSSRVINERIEHHVTFPFWDAPFPAPFRARNPVILRRSG